jgi:hypothetical protein
VEAGEADDIAEWGLGTRSLSEGTIHSAGCPSTFAASWPPATSRPRDNVVAVERSHTGGSMTVMGCWGAIRMGGGTRNGKQERLREQRRKGKNGSGAEAREAGMENAKCKVKKPPLFRLSDLYTTGRALRSARPARINCK